MSSSRLPGGGPGYYRTPSLISCWSSAPFLHNNTLGKFTGDPSGQGGWRHQRAAQESCSGRTAAGQGFHLAHDEECQFSLHGDYIPEPLRTLLKPHMTRWLLPHWQHSRGDAGNLLANVDPDMKSKGLLELWHQDKEGAAEIKLKNLDAAAAKEVLSGMSRRHLEVSSARTLSRDRGHFYGTDLANADKNALIEYLKTL